MSETLLSELTTLGVGGPARTYVRARTEQEIIDALIAADDAGDQVLILGGGSNLVVGDDGFDGTVVHTASTGITVRRAEDGRRARLSAEAGEDWDGLVARSLEEGLSGLETLSGIPGTVGATPVQNVGAYGTEISQHFASARLWDRVERRVEVFDRQRMAFAYRDSALKREMLGPSPRWAVLQVSFDLEVRADSAPLRYAELARSLGTEVGERVPASRVREAVLRLRAGKGMVLDPADRDTHSTGSFFTNPIIPADAGADLPADAPRYPVLDADGAVDESLTKLSAAWLIQHAGFDKGYGLEGESAAVAGGRAALSTKHTLAITNRGQATAADVVAVARAVREGVQREFGVRLEAEPVVVGTRI